VNTLPVSLSALVLIGAGLVFLWMAQRGHRTGELRAGRSGFRVYRPRRSESPVAFYGFLLLYIAFGSWLVIRGIAVALGRVGPLPLQ